MRKKRQHSHTESTRADGWWNGLSDRGFAVAKGVVNVSAPWRQIERLGR
jgi:hypothetical protein